MKCNGNIWQLSADFTIDLGSHFSVQVQLTVKWFNTPECARNGTMMPTQSSVLFVHTDCFSVCIIKGVKRRCFPRENCFPVCFIAIQYFEFVSVSYYSCVTIFILISTVQIVFLRTGD